MPGPGSTQHGPGPGVPGTRPPLGPAHARGAQREVTQRDGGLRDGGLRDGGLRDGRDFATARPLVRESWMRSSTRLSDPAHAVVRDVLDADALAHRRASHPLNAVFPLIRSLLSQPAKDHGLILAVGDAAGRLLWVEGDSRTRDRAEDMAFLAGADWSEESMGTSAPALALTTGAGVQILREEHFSPLAVDFSCSAVPLLNPHTGDRLGFLDLTGDDRAADSLILPYLRATAAAVQAHLLGTLERPTSPALSPVTGALPLIGPIPTPRTPSPPRERIEVSSPRPAAAQGADGTGANVVVHLTGPELPELRVAGNPTRLSLRHAEILGLLAAAPHGLDAGELSDRLYPGRVPAVTLRAEIARLRKLLDASGASAAGVELTSRPYRLRGLSADALCVQRLLDRGSHRRALAAYRGPILPASEAPGVVRWRDELSATLREAVLGDGSVEAVLEYLGLPEGCDDEEALQLALKVLPPRSPKRAGILTRLEALRGQIA